jgi:hypothetical protein
MEFLWDLLSKYFVWFLRIFDFLDVLKNKVLLGRIFFEYIFDLNSDIIDSVLKSMKILHYGFLISMLTFYNDNSQTQVIRFDPTKKRLFDKNTIYLIYKAKVGGNKAKFIINSEDLKKIYRYVDHEKQEIGGNFIIIHKVRAQMSFWGNHILLIYLLLHLNIEFSFIHIQTLSNCIKTRILILLLQILKISLYILTPHYQDCVTPWSFPSEVCTSSL